MSIKKNLYGVLDNKNEVYSYTLDNHKGMKVEILSFGGIVKRIILNEVDVVLGYDKLEDYIVNKGCLGSTVGRHANRIENSQFTINGTTYKVGTNEGRNSLHGGIIGYHKKLWDVKEAGTDDEPAIILQMLSPDGEEGFPGNLKVSVTFTLTKENSLHINYKAISDKDTVCNLTNHSYFNLNGHTSGTILNHELQLNADFFTPNTNACIPYGEIKGVKGTAFDFTSFKKVGDGINSSDEQIKMFSGFDHNFALNGFGYRKFATLKGDKSGIVMECYTDKPGVQLYTGNGLRSELVYKDNSKYVTHQGLCLETQFFPNSTTFSHFPSAYLKKDVEYNYTTEYKFIF